MRNTCVGRLRASRLRACWAVAVLSLAGVRAAAQTAPQGAVTGRVRDPDELPVANISVTVSSPALQRARATTTSPAGAFLIPFLPPGEYEIVVGGPGWRDSRLSRRLGVGETATIDVELEVEAVVETVEARAEPERIVGTSSGITATYTEQLLDKLPVEKDWSGALELAPAATRTAPGGGVNVSGSMSYETAYILNGVVVNGTLGGRPRPFAIDDAIQEIAVSAAGISAEYGRFTGGVVNMVTRSGGDTFHGTLRNTLQNDAWRELTPYERQYLETDPRNDRTRPSYSATLGGPLRRERLWFFAAARDEETSETAVLPYTDLLYPHDVEETRWEAKLTWSPAASTTLYVRGDAVDYRERNASAFGPMDLASLFDSKVPEEVRSVGVTTNLGARYFLEAQASERTRDVIGVGTRSTDLIGGTTIWDNERGSPYHSAYFCAVCGAAPGELNRDATGNRNGVLKLSGFLPDRRGGSHTVVAGAEIYEDFRRNDTWQTGSGYQVGAATSIFRDGEIYPVILPGDSYIEWRPIFETSRGSRLRSYSAYANDVWRLGQNWALNVGLRWDKNDSLNQAHARVSQQATWSPRLSVAFDPRSDGVWSIDAGFGRYVAALASLISDEGSTAGRSAAFVYDYQGPPINEDPEVPDPLTADQALGMVFDWFFANGGADLPFASAPFIPGLTRRTGPGLRSPTVDEYRIGAARTLRDRGRARLDVVHREFHDQYAERVDTTTGNVADPRGRLYDLRLIENSDAVKRSYTALAAQLEYRFVRGVEVGATYTLARTRGNFDGDNRSPAGGAVADRDVLFYPEYGDPSWRTPVGGLAIDQRHKARLWALGDWQVGSGGGVVQVGLVERFDSGLTYDLLGFVDSRPYVENPGYETPPRAVRYYFGPRGEFHSGSATATDLALRYGFRLRLRGEPEIFARIAVINVFNQAAQTGAGIQGVLTALDDESYAPFDPFHEQPVRGVHWDRVPDAGMPVGPEDYQQPRTYTAAVGLRF